MLRRDADTAVAALSDHFLTTMHLVELASPARERTSGPAKTEGNKPSVKINNMGENDMIITRRRMLATMTSTALLTIPGVAQAAEKVRIGLPTKTYWPTTIAQTAVQQKLFEKEGLDAELTIYRGGAETFEAMAAGASDLILDACSLPAAAARRA